MKLSVWDILTIVVLIATAVVLILVLTIFLNPDSAINPFPKPTLPATIMVPSSTATLWLLPPTWTPTPRIEATRLATSTPEPSATPLVLPTQ